MKQRDVLLIGTGISGLLAAQVLVEAGQRVTLVDKGRSVGGRLATRRIGPGRADHGAQFFTVRNELFRSYVEQWQAAGLAYVWGTGWSDGSLVDTPNDGHARYAIHGGMNTLAKHLADQLVAAGATIHIGRQITAITQTGEGWTATDDGDGSYTGDALVLTPPVPQSLALLDAGPVSLHRDDRAALEQVSYAPCLCGLFWLEGKIELPAPGALQRPGADISWVADNQAKGISPDAQLITVHAGPAYSETYYDAPDEELLATFQASLQPFTAGRIKTHAAQLKHWRYALPTALHPERYLQAQELPPLLFGGDAFGHPRVEGAALSGLAIGEQVKKWFE
jgi:predicted NAD/FAD-dependent oxidoreductase